MNGALSGRPAQGRRWHRRRDLRFVAVAAVLIAAYYAHGYATGAGRITDRLHAALDADPGRLDIRVTSRFPPEAFHIELYQRYGGMRGTEGATVTLFGVRPSDVRRLSRRYWIARIDLAPR